LSVALGIQHAIRMRPVICGLPGSTIFSTLSHKQHDFQKTFMVVKWTRYRPGVAQRVGRGIALLFPDRGTRRGWVVSSTFRPHFTPRERPGTHCTGDWVGPMAGLDGRKNLVPTGIRFRTVHLVVSRYIDWTTGPTEKIYLAGNVYFDFLYSFVWNISYSHKNEMRCYHKCRSVFI